MGGAPILAERVIAATSRDQTFVSTIYRRCGRVGTLGTASALWRWAGHAITDNDPGANNMEWTIAHAAVVVLRLVAPSIREWMPLAASAGMFGVACYELGSFCKNGLGRRAGWGTGRHVAGKAALDHPERLASQRDRMASPRRHLIEWLGRITSRW
jgi:hypothetical protein